MNLFYHPESSIGKSIIFDQAEAMHLTKVLRKKSGDQINLTDGCGNLFQAIIEIGKRETVATILEGEKMSARKNLLEVAVAPTKNNERLEWFVEKAVEMGIDKISLILCEHSERPHLRTDRLQKIAIAAMKQSLKYYLPEIVELKNYSDWLLACNMPIRCIAHCEQGQPRLLFQKAIAADENVAIAIGPEGDFSKTEIEQALSNGFKAVSLGNARLRTETAALAAVHTFELVNQI